MSAKVAALVALFLVHPIFGALYAQHPLSDPRTETVLLLYVLVTHALLTYWTWLDVRITRPESLYVWLVAPAIFNFAGVGIYLAATRPAGSWRRWLLRGCVFTAACIFTFGQVFTWAFGRANGA